MDPINQSQNNLNTQAANPEQNRSREILKKKWVLGIVVVLVLVAFLLPLLMPGGQKSVTETRKQFPTIVAPSSYPTRVLNPASPFSPEQLKIIEEQRKADKAVGDREIEIKTKFPWFIYLPLRGEKYFVYFETNSQVFWGLLYPKAGDDVDQMKQEIKKKLKENIGVPDLENYKFEWKVTPE